MFFIPEKINVGFQERNDTYTNKLAYVIYFDEKNVLRKEKSWDGWRDKKIPNEIFENVPTSGFVLNKKAGGYSTGWNHRQSYIRVFDPRGFEFEITVKNLIYILENNNSIKGKGLEGEFIYGWEGADLVLISIDDPNYQDNKVYCDSIFSKNSFKAKDLKIGFEYSTKNGNSVFVDKGNFSSEKTKEFLFFNVENNYFFFKSNLNNFIIKEISTEKVYNYLDILEFKEYNLDCNMLHKKEILIEMTEEILKLNIDFCLDKHSSDEHKTDFFHLYYYKEEDKFRYSPTIYFKKIDDVILMSIKGDKFDLTMKDFIKNQKPYCKIDVCGDKVLKNYHYYDNPNFNNYKLPIWQLESFKVN